MSNSNQKEFYLNPIAHKFVKNESQVKCLIAGRGFSKSFCHGAIFAGHAHNIPRGRSIFLGETYTQILTNTLLPIISAWEWYGYIEDVDYVIGKKPPSYFAKPLSQTKQYENVITFFNGYSIILGSMDRPALIRGGSNDTLSVDEAFRTKFDDLDAHVFPSIRGSHPSLRDKKGALQKIYTSSMPYGNSGKWLLDLEAQSKDPANSTFYIEGSTLHNWKVLGKKAIMEMKRDMSPTRFAIEVLNKRIQYGSLFYPSLTDKHFYTAENYSHILNLGLKINQKRDSRWDDDCDTNLPLNISHDWGAFNCITIDQYHQSTKTVKMINAMHVVHPNIIDDLANKFCDYYEHHKRKVVYQWGDKSGNKKEANAKLSYFQQFASILNKRGWRVIMMKVGDIDSLARHDFFNKVHRSGYPISVEYNAENCKDLRIALETAPMKDNKKDKSSENNPNVKQQHATHYTDAHDYRLYWGFVSMTKSTGHMTPVSFS